MKYVIFHHDDLDGLCSGAIIKKHLIKAHGESIEGLSTFECNYDRDHQLKVIEDADLSEEDVVYIVDYCFDDDLMQMLLRKLRKNNLVWIDHHSTAIKRMENYKIDGVRDTRYSATMLCWVYSNGDKQAPRVVRYIDTYDCWKRKNEDEWNGLIVPFKYALESQTVDLNDANNIWDNLLDNDSAEDIGKLIAEGTVIKRYVEWQHIKDAEGSAYTCLFEGHRALCINKIGVGSQALEATFDPAEHDIMLIFAINNKSRVEVGLYTTKKEIHVGEIAQKFGGGGHPGAAGFSVEARGIDMFLRRAI